MLKTRITELFGIEYPIIQGGIMWVSGADLIAAVSNAGGLGILTSLNYPTPEDLAAEIEKTKKLTEKPFGVNLTLLPTLNPVDYDGYIEVIVKSGIKIMETSGRNPEGYIAQLKSAGIKVIHKCTSVRFARKAQQIGCDAVCINGFECAGHPGTDDVTSLVIIPVAVDALEIPVIASGGFGDGRGLIAALALGAEGISMGTRFMITQESIAHPKFKEWMVQASEYDTTLVERSIGNTMRAIKNAAAEKVLEMERRGASFEELAPFISGKLGKKVMETGEMDVGVFTCGQVIGLIRDVPTVKQLMDSIISEAREVVMNINTGGVFKPVRKPLVTSSE